MAEQNKTGHTDTENTEQHLLNNSYDREFKVLVEHGLQYDGASLQRSLSSCVASKITVSGSITYVAIAPAGTAQETEKWQVKKVEEVDANNTVITWADGNTNFDNAATDLTALAYS